MHGKIREGNPSFAIIRLRRHLDPNSQNSKRCATATSHVEGIEGVGEGPQKLYIRHIREGSGLLGWLAGRGEGIRSQVNRMANICFEKSV